MIINITGTTNELSKKEILRYQEYAINKYPDQSINTLNINIDGDFVNLGIEFESVPFMRIRRITGYLTGDYRRMNDAKRSEIKDRVKHSL